MSSQPTVFVVDDDPPVLKALTLSLSKRGFSVVGYPTAEAFLAEYDPGQPGCLILDLRLSGMSGLELQKALHEKDVGIPIIFVSGHGDIPSSVDAIKGGAIDFLEKPIRQDLLIERIEEALDEDRKNRAADTKRHSVESRLERLTERELDVLRRLVAESSATSSKAIARALGISPRTVESHRARIMEKMEAKSLTDLVTMAKLCGL